MKDIIVNNIDNLNKDNIDVETLYKTSGEFVIDSYDKDNISVKQLESMIEDAISEISGVHKQDVSVVVDPDTGAVEFIVNNKKYDLTKGKIIILLTN